MDNTPESTGEHNDSWWYSDANTPDSQYEEWLLTNGRCFIPARSRRYRGLFNWSHGNSTGQQEYDSNCDGDGDDISSEDFHSVNSDHQEPADTLTPSSSSSKQSFSSVQEHNYEDSCKSVATMIALEPVLSDFKYEGPNEDFQSSSESLYLVAEPENELTGIEKQPYKKYKAEAYPPTDFESVCIRAPGSFFWRTKEYAALQGANSDKSSKTTSETNFYSNETPFGFVTSLDESPPSAKKSSFQINSSDIENPSSFSNLNLFNDIFDSQMQVSLNSHAGLHAINSTQQAEASDNDIILSFDVSETQFHPSLQEKSQLNLMTKEVARDYMGFDHGEFKKFPVFDTNPAKLCIDCKEKATIHSQRQENKQIIDNLMMTNNLMSIKIQDDYHFLDSRNFYDKDDTGTDAFNLFKDGELNPPQFSGSCDKTFNSVRVLRKAKRGKKSQKQKTKKFECKHEKKNQTAFDVFPWSTPEIQAIKISNIDEKSDDEGTGDSTFYSSETFNKTLDLLKPENKSKIPVAIPNMISKMKLKITASTLSFPVVAKKPSPLMSKSKIPVPITNYVTN